MKKNLSIIGLIVILVACSSSKKNVSTASEEQKKAVISFISKGGGANSDLFTKTKALLDGSKCEVSYQVKPWGREGEKDICLQSTADCYQKVMKEVQALINSNELVQIKEGAECRK